MLYYIRFRRGMVRDKVDSTGLSAEEEEEEVVVKKQGGNGRSCREI